MADEALWERVLEELRGLRRQPSGVTVDTLTLAPVICRLLGSGDPYVAYTRLQHGLIDATFDRPMKAAAASLGFTTKGGTHLQRLDEAGAELSLDQRQVRRLSNQGLAVLASLIATNWTVEAVPELTTVLTTFAEVSQVAIAATAPFVVEMSEPEVTLLRDGGRGVPVDAEWKHAGEGEIERLTTTVMIPHAPDSTSVDIVWRGELWPKWTVYWNGQVADVSAEALGNKLRIGGLAPPET